MASKGLILAGNSALRSRSRSCSYLTSARPKSKKTPGLTAFSSHNKSFAQIGNCRNAATDSKMRLLTLAPSASKTLLARINPTKFCPPLLSMQYHHIVSPATARNSATLFKKELQLYGTRQVYMNSRTHCLSPCSSGLFLSTQNRKKNTGTLATSDFLFYNQLLISDPLISNQWRWRSGLSQRKRDNHRKNIRTPRESSEYISISSLHDQSSNSKASGEDPKENKDEADKNEDDPDRTKKLSLYQRFKNTYKQHGKVLIGVHVITSAMWAGSFYAAARCGIDIVPYLENWNFSEKVISPFRSGGLGDVALAYLFYKLATPARYTVTIAGTNLAIKYLRKEGKMKEVPEEDKLRSLYQEGKEDLKKKSGARIRHLRRKAKKRVVRKHKH